MHGDDVIPAQDLEYRVLRLLCRRTGQMVPPAEHEHCPYCFGSAADVAHGTHERFCGYDPARDPVHFGFPDEATRDVEG